MTAECGGLGGPRPSINFGKQNKEIQDLMETSLIKGDTWYLVDITWFKKWKKYVGYECWDMDNVGLETAFPGPVDNVHLLKSDRTSLNEGLTEELDYVLVPTDAWNRLVLWYGIMQGQVPIARKVVEHGMFVKYCNVEVYLMELKLCKNSNQTEYVIKQFSKADKIATIEKVMRETFKIPDKTEVRIWNKYMSNTYEEPADSNSTIEEAGICQGKVLIVEEKNLDGSWPRPTTVRNQPKLSHTNNNVPGPKAKKAKTLSSHLWYWQDEHGIWIEYADQNTNQNGARSDKESSDFESLYQAFRNGNGNSAVQFNAGNQHYTLNFHSMTQINDHSGTRRSVCRRPANHKLTTDVQKDKEQTPHNIYPSTWDTSIRTTSSHRLVNVLQYNDEYKKVIDLFQSTLPGRANIVKLERVQNELCWDAFARQKEHMMKKNNYNTVEERQLFHGTTQDKVEDICRDNFDFRLSGTRVGAAYGQTAMYSNKYAQLDRYRVQRMFVAKVLVGSYTLGQKELRRPLYKNLSDKALGMFDSCVDNVQSPTIFVVFDNYRVYPEYLITYSFSPHYR